MKKRTLVNHPPRVTLDSDNIPLVAPVYQSAKFSVPTVAEVKALIDGRREGFLYSRVSNPTLKELELLLAQLQGRNDAICFSSGVGALSTLFLSLLKQGDHVILFRECYRPTRYLVNKLLNKFGVQSSLIGVDQLDDLSGFIKDTTRLIHFESPTNPTTRVPDISKIVSVAQDRDILTVMDNTFAGFHNHGQLEIDYFVHSLTKFAGGHSDVMGGAIIGSQRHVAPIKRDAAELGANLDPHAAFLILRGLKTYQLRYQRQCASALAVALMLEKHPGVKTVLYPGLESHPDYSVAVEQLNDFGAIISFDIEGGESKRDAFIDRLALFKLTASLGCTESVVAPSRLFYGGDYSPDQQAQVGLNAGTIRLSIGIEDLEDIMYDLQQAL